MAVVHFFVTVVAACCFFISGDVMAFDIEAHRGGRALFPELRALTAEACGKSVIKQHRAEAIELPWPSETLTDLDFPADVQRIRARLEAA